MLPNMFDFVILYFNIRHIIHQWEKTEERNAMDDVHRWYELSSNYATKLKISLALVVTI